QTQGQGRRKGGERRTKNLARRGENETVEQPSQGKEKNPRAQGRTGPQASIGSPRDPLERGPPRRRRKTSPPTGPQAPDARRHRSDAALFARHGSSWLRRSHWASGDGRV